MIKKQLLFSLACFLMFSFAAAQTPILQSDLEVTIDEGFFSLLLDVRNTSLQELRDIEASLLLDGESYSFEPIDGLKANEYRRLSLKTKNPWSPKGNYYLPVHIRYLLPNGEPHAQFSIAEITQDAVDTPEIISSVEFLPASDDETLYSQIRIRNLSQRKKDLSISVLPATATTQIFREDYELDGADLISLDTHFNLQLRDTRHLIDYLLTVDYEQDGYHYSQLARYAFQPAPAKDKLLWTFSQTKAVDIFLLTLALLLAVLILLEVYKQRKSTSP